MKKDKYNIMIINQETGEVVRQLNGVTSYTLLGTDKEQVHGAHNINIDNIKEAACLLGVMNEIREKVINNDVTLAKMDIHMSMDMWSKMANDPIAKFVEEVEEADNNNVN